MSPQFVDFDADGHLDIVAGIFDGSPHVALATAKGWQQPVPILDREGGRIVMNDFWNFETKKWDATTRCDPAGVKLAKGHLTSAWAADWDGDGDLDLLLGDHKGGHVLVRVNEGTAKQPAFATKNTAVLVDGKPLVVPGTVTTLRLVDGNGDGRLDLLAGSMGDTYATGAGGGVYLYPNTGTNAAPALAQPIALVPPSAKGAVEPTRPDAGLYMDLVDHDGDGDLDLLVGGYSQWTPPTRELSAAEKARAAELRAELAALGKATAALSKVVTDATKGLDGAASAAKRAELLGTQAAERTTLGKQRQGLQTELDALVPGPKRVSYVWVYENRTERASKAAADASGDRR